MVRSVPFAMAGLLLALPTSASARTWHILPDGTGDAPTIQAGVDSAAAGDIVLVAPGTYFENLNLKSDVTLQSDGGAAATTIDGSSAGGVIDCVGVSSSTTIRGFTLTNGIGTFAFNGRYGGAIRCWEGASPLIEENVLVSNSATFGGGVGCRYGSVPHIRNNEFRDNTAAGGGYGEGGAIYAIDGGGRTITIEGNEIRDNTAESGGGVWVGGIDAVITGNTIVGNSAAADRLIGGGGIWAGFSGTKSITGNVIAANVSSDLGGGAWIAQGSTVLARNTFYGNSAPLGGALGLGWGIMIIHRNILAGSPQGAAIFVNNPSVATALQCNNLWNNAGGDQIPPPLADSGGGFSADPLFCDPENGDFTIQSDSPCAPPGVTGCGLVGALPVGCGPVGVAQRSWGQIKGLYR